MKSEENFDKREILYKFALWSAHCVRTTIAFFGKSILYDKLEDIAGAKIY